MDDRNSVRQAIERYVAGINANDVAGIPLTEDVEFHGAMLAEPKIGESAVREHLAQIAPFITMTLRELLIDGDRAATVVEIAAVNGVTVLGAGFFTVRDGRICRDQGFTDTHRLFAGSR